MIAEFCVEHFFSDSGEKAAVESFDVSAGSYFGEKVLSDRLDFSDSREL
jgi:hypothetical protein